MNSLGMVFKYTLKSKWQLLLTLIFMFLGAGASIVVPRITEKIINGIRPENANPISNAELIKMIVFTIGLGLASAIITGVGRYFAASVGTKSMMYLRGDTYHAINRQTFSYFDKTETGQLIARTTSDIETTFPMFNMGTTMGIQSTVILVMALIAVNIMLPSFGIYLIILVAIYYILIFIIANKMRKPYMESRETFGKLTTTIRENILGAQVVRIFNSQNKEKNKFAKNNNDFREYTIQTIKWQTILRNVGRTIIALLAILGLYIGGKMVIIGEIEIGTLIALAGYIAMLGMPLFMFNGVVINFVAADAALTRVRDVLESMPEIIEKEDAISAESIKGNIRFDHVNFGYTSNLVLKDITFSVSAGSNVAILGTTGSGKSTLISLLPRFYDVVDGAIYIDDINIKDYKLQELRNQIGTVSQNIFLFNKSIADNIRFGKEKATIEDVITAAKQANIHDFIQTLPDGYNTIIGERGQSLSGGQKQRIAIARALIIHPKILILDDSTSAVDVETEYIIQQAMIKLMQNRTSFIITQRLSTIRNAEKIVVMDQGRIVGIGTHKKLYEKNPLYKQIYETLFDKQRKLEKKKIIEVGKLEVEN